MDKGVKISTKEVKVEDVRKTKVKRDQMLNFFKKHASKAPIGECVNFADEYQNLYEEEYRLSKVIAVLASYFCGEHGKFVKERLPKKSPAIQWALKEVQHRHAWVVCGPVSDGMKEFLERVGQEDCTPEIIKIMNAQWETEGVV